MTTTPNGEEKSSDIEPAFVETPAGADGVAPDTGVAKIDVNDHQLSHPDSFKIEQEKAQEEANKAAPKRPAKNGKKEAWVEYANSRGVDSNGSVAEISARVDEVDAKDKAAQKQADEDAPKAGLGKKLKDLPSDRLPVSSRVGEVLMTVETNRAGLRVLNVSMFGYLGDVPVSILAEQAGDLRDALDQLEEQAK